MSKHINFERSSLSQIKGFKDLNLFDEMIQNSLDKYSYTNVLPKLDETSEKFHDYIINEESLIPDLIIYNKTFNKNECYYEYYDYGFNKYPRKKFVLKATKDNIQDNNNTNNENTVNNDEQKTSNEILEKTNETKEENVESKEQNEIKEEKK